MFRIIRFCLVSFVVRGQADQPPISSSAMQDIVASLYDAIAIRLERRIKTKKKKTGYLFSFDLNKCRYFCVATSWLCFIPVLLQPCPLLSLSKNAGLTCSFFFLRGLQEVVKTLSTTSVVQLATNYVADNIAATKFYLSDPALAPTLLASFPPPFVFYFIRLPITVSSQIVL
jgi:hypothetical protein